MSLSSHEQKVVDYYDKNTDGFYLAGWDPDNIHFGIFDQSKDAEYDRDPEKALQDRKLAIVKMTEAIVGPAFIQPRAFVLDAGCGVGGTSIFMAEKYGSTVIGLNINEKQLGIARERARDAGVDDRVSFQYCDCSQELPFDDGFVDVVVNLESACHFSNRPRFIAECARVLKPGGKVVAQDWMAADRISDADRETFVTPMSDAWRLFDIESLKSYVDLLEGAGFEVAESEHLEEGIRPNAYIMRMGYQRLSLKEAAAGLTDYETENKERVGTFSRALLDGHLKIGRYLAVKP